MAGRQDDSLALFWPSPSSSTTLVCAETFPCRLLRGLESSREKVPKFAKQNPTNHARAGACKSVVSRLTDGALLRCGPLRGGNGLFPIVLTVPAHSGCEESGGPLLARAPLKRFDLLARQVSQNKNL